MSRVIIKKYEDKWVVKRFKVESNIFWDNKQGKRRKIATTSGMFPPVRKGKTSRPWHSPSQIRKRSSGKENESVSCRTLRT